MSNKKIGPSMTVEEPPSLTTPLKLVKPDISAFSFSGYLQKSSKSNTKVGPTPRTPSKKINTKMLFTGPPTPLFTHQRHPSGSSNELRSDGTFEFQDSHSNLDTLFSPFLSSDDRDMVSPSFSRRIERSSSFGGSSPIAHRSELDNEEPAEFDFESVDDKIMNTDANLPSWIVDSPNFLSPEFFQKLDQNPYFLGFLNEQPQSGAEYFLENFKIIEIIGRGDFADVYKCLDLSDQMFYSIKKTREVFTGFNDRCRKLEEARVLFDIGKHPHCLRAHVSWEQRGCFYIQSELCELGTLANFINRVSFQEEYVSEQLIWAILLHISLGLKHIHDRGYIHMDIKPSNILIDNFGNLKIADFGLTMPAGQDHSFDIEGDNVYLAPELLEGICDRSSDIFSLGLIVLELAANIELPSQGDSWQRLRHEDFADIIFDNIISSRLQNLIFGMLRTNPYHRVSLEFIISEACMSGIPVDCDMRSIFEPILQCKKIEESPFY